MVIEMAVKVMLVDNHILMREGIRQILEFDGSVEVIEEANDGEECMRKLAKCKPEVLLLDINMPKKNGIEVLQEIKDKKIDVKIIILTVHNEIEYLLKAIDIGADGYLLKDSESSELKKAIKTVMSGESYIQPNLIPALNHRLLARDTDKDKIDSLTKKELDILIGVAEGKNNKEIGSSMNLTERTIKNYITKIFKKINVTDRTQAAVFAIKNNLIDLY